MITNATEKEMEEALRTTNRKFDNNIKFNRFERQDKRIRFTLTVHSSKEAGAKRLPRLDCSVWEAIKIKKWRRVHAACWHVYGTFFDALFDQNPNVWVQSVYGGRMTAASGNWNDYQVGSIIFPYHASDCCECETTK